MSATQDPSNHQTAPPNEIAAELATSRWLSRMQPLLLILFVTSTVVFLALALIWRGRTIVPGLDTPNEVPPIPTQTFWLILAAATSLASLVGMVANTIFGWRKEQREARAEALDRQRQELEIRKLQLELEREGARAVDGPGPAQEPPQPEQGERQRLEDQWSELNKRYEDLSTRVAAVDNDIAQALDSERLLVLQRHRGDLTAQRDRLAVAMADVERRLAKP